MGEHSPAEVEERSPVEGEEHSPVDEVHLLHTGVAGPPSCY